MPAANTFEAQRPRPPPRRFTPEARLSTVLTLSASLLLTAYYFSGGNFLPLTVLLPIAGQVLSRGVVAALSLLLDGLARLSASCGAAIPADVLSALLVEVDGRFGPPLSPIYLLSSATVTLLLLHTPEVLLGAFATRGSDTRLSRPRVERARLGPFGGAAGPHAYFTSGLLLVSAEDPEKAYAAIAAAIPSGELSSANMFFVPRKPDLFYRSLDDTTRRDPHVYVARNTGVVVSRVSRGASRAKQGCEEFSHSDFGFALNISACAHEISFAFDTTDRRHFHATFSLRLATGATTYTVENSRRVVSATHVVAGEHVAFPRAGDMFRSMGRCMLNSVSFQNHESQPDIPTRLVLSALVRQASMHATDPTGFADAQTVDAVVREVIETNLSRWLVVTSWVSSAIVVLMTIVFAIRGRLLAAELVQLVAVFRDIAEVPFARLPRQMRDVEPIYGREAVRNLWVRFEDHGLGPIFRVVRDDDEQVE